MLWRHLKLLFTLKKQTNSELILLPNTTIVFSVFFISFLPYLKNSVVSMESMVNNFIKPNNWLKTMKIHKH